MKLLTTGLLLAGLLAAPPARAQTASAPFACYFLVEPVPELPGGGGSRAIVQAVQKRVAYPAAALRANVEGRLFVAFAITPAGRVQDVRVVKSLRPDCDAAAVHAVQHLPRFKRRPVRYGTIQYTLPVTFRITGSRRRFGPPSRHETQQAAHRAALGWNPTR